jgi:hypothetical protein
MQATPRLRTSVEVGGGESGLEAADGSIKDHANGDQEAHRCAQGMARSVTHSAVLNCAPESMNSTKSYRRHSRQ